MQIACIITPIILTYGLHLLIFSGGPEYPFRNEFPLPEVCKAESPVYSRSSIYAVSGNLKGSRRISF